MASCFTSGFQSHNSSYSGKFLENCRNKVQAWKDGALNHPKKSSKTITIKHSAQSQGGGHSQKTGAQLMVPTQATQGCGTSTRCGLGEHQLWRNRAAYLSISYSFIPTFTAFITWRTDIKQRHSY